MPPSREPLIQACGHSVLHARARGMHLLQLSSCCNNGPAFIGVSRLRLGFVTSLLQSIVPQRRMEIGSLPALPAGAGGLQQLCLVLSRKARAEASWVPGLLASLTAEKTGWCDSAVSRGCLAACACLSWVVASRVL